MELLGEKIIKLQDAKYKIQQNNSNEASIFISGNLAAKLNLSHESKNKFKINKEDVIKLLCFTFSFKKTIYKKDLIKLDMIWFERMLKLINDHFDSNSEFIFAVKKQSQDRYYFIALEQGSGFNIRDLFIQDHVKLQFFREESLIKIECSNEVFLENNIGELTIDKDVILKEAVLRQFALKSFKYLTNKYGADFLINNKPTITESETSSGEKYKTYLFSKYFTQGLLFSFDKEPIKNEQRTTPRFIDVNLDILNQNYIYISTEWAFSGTSNLLFSQLVKFIEAYSKDKFTAIGDGGINPYELILKDGGSRNISFNYKTFHQNAEFVGLNFSVQLIHRFIASLISKPFLILSGLSGSGKTKIAQSFVQWICENDTQYKIVPVGADWTNREPLVGYPNGLVAEEYITPDSGVIHLLLEAIKQGNENKPFFLILDEMNLSHVERYFADFLSIMESNDTIKLYTGNTRESLDKLEIPLEISWPKNVFIIGTVNIDETTYMFSPKVLDRANVIEFRITDDEIKDFLASPGIPDLQKLKGQGIAMAESFLSTAAKTDIVTNEALTNELVYFFNELKKVGAEFGYRSATEIMQLAAKLKMLEPRIADNDCLDIAIMQKLLPKLHGSRSKLVKILIALSGLCVEDITKEEFEKKYEDLYKKDFEGLTKKYPISFEKLIRMYKNVLANGFTSYAEA
jgi:5-methylcytosine-specific restriction protein B